MRVKLTKTTQASAAKVERGLRKLERAQMAAEHERDHGAVACPPYPSKAAEKLLWTAWRKRCPEKRSRTENLLYTFNVDPATNVVTFIEKGRGDLICAHQLSHDVSKVVVQPLEVGKSPKKLRKKSEKRLALSLSRANPAEVAKARDAAKPTAKPTARTRGIKTA